MTIVADDLRLDWAGIRGSLRDDGYAVTSPFLSKRDCEEIRGFYALALGDRGTEAFRLVSKAEQMHASSPHVALCPK